MSRPSQCAEVLRRISVSGCTSRGVVFVNGESHKEEYIRSLRLPFGWQIIYYHKNLGCIGALNYVFEMYPNEPWYGFIGDDEFLSPDSPQDWDMRLIKSAGDWHIAHAFEDWNKGKRCQGFPVWGGKLLRAVGYWALPTCWHNFGLDSMHEWLNGPPAFGGGGLRNIVCIPEVKIEHNRANPFLELDDCYNVAEGSMEEDRKRFWDWISRELKPTAERVRGAMAHE